MAKEPPEAKALSDVIKSVGNMARDRIRALPPDLQEIAWATVASGILGAAIHDTNGSPKVLNFLASTLRAFVAFQIKEEMRDAAAAGLKPASHFKQHSRNDPFRSTKAPSRRRRPQ